MNKESLRIDGYLRLYDSFRGVQAFLEHKPMSYYEFDYYSVNGLNLFSLDLDFDFEKMVEYSKEITKIMPSIKRIFSKPIIELSDNNDVLPVESVRIINQNTMRHLGTHTNNVIDITKNGIKPAKLLTRIYEDNFSIYENIVFCNFVDEIIKFSKKSIRVLDELIYASDIMQFNILERKNHINYFLALGKLHTSYIREFDKHYNQAKLTLNELKLLLANLKSRLKRPIYVNNKNRNHNVRLKKTNIFLMQKDYHVVYVLYRKMLKDVIKPTNQDLDMKKLNSSYSDYLKALAIFSIGHFNFNTDKSKEIDMKKLKMSFSYKGFDLVLKKYKDNIIIRVKKEQQYSIMLKPYLEECEIESPFGVNKVDEIVLCNPLEDNDLKDETLYLSTDSIDSFRRIQTLVLKCMVYADTKRDECPFCDSKLLYNEKANAYVCESCKTEIKTNVCEYSKREFFSTKIFGYKPTRTINLDSYDKERGKESLMYFRNITKTNEDGNPICPYCGKIHE